MLSNLLKESFSKKFLSSIKISVFSNMLKFFLVNSSLKKSSTKNFFLIIKIFNQVYKGYFSLIFKVILKVFSITSVMLWLADTTEDISILLFQNNK